jgi:hypothetical protein
MKVLKIIVGVLASLFAFAHAVALIVAIIGPRRYEGALELSRYGGHIFGICFGAIIAVLCFRRRPPRHGGAKRRR